MSREVARASLRQLTGAAVLAYFARLRGDVPEARIGELAKRFAAELHRPVRELSTGNRQKIGLIQAFMGEPELLILDEPIAGLDPLVQRRFHDLLADVRAQGRTVLRNGVDPGHLAVLGAVTAALLAAAAAGFRDRDLRG